MSSPSVAPPARRSNASTTAFLLPSRAPASPSGRCGRGAFAADARFLFALGLRAALACAGATAGLCGATAGLSCPRAFQTRLTPTLRLVNLLTGTTPGRLFQISTRRAAGQLPASCANSSRLLNLSGPSTSGIAAPDSRIVMLLSVSMTYPDIAVLLAYLLICWASLQRDHIHHSTGRSKQVQIESSHGGPLRVATNNLSELSGQRAETEVYVSSCPTTQKSCR